MSQRVTKSMQTLLIDIIKGMLPLQLHSRGRKENPGCDAKCTNAKTAQIEKRREHQIFFFLLAPWDIIRTSIRDLCSFQT